jgi:hypothetical protein
MNKRLPWYDPTPKNRPFWPLDQTRPVLPLGRTSSLRSQARQLPASGTDNGSDRQRRMRDGAPQILLERAPHRGVPSQLNSDHSQCKPIERSRYCPRLHRRGRACILRDHRHDQTRRDRGAPGLAAQQASWAAREEATAYRRASEVPADEGRVVTRYLPEV